MSCSSIRVCMCGMLLFCVLGLTFGCYVSDVNGSCIFSFHIIFCERFLGLLYE